ncbi:MULTISPECIES: hypothetical protein [unclassified Curtobacterium]|uniref:hypothetical protein n=1 Tax=unclassified Curtobacterium TaxID=257496 RepID=UPI000DA6E9F9|nr:MULTISPECIES: hypothetical protein [unclassified Curtobacterium]PZE26047.1 hypothetical protein DEI86_09450 [Curtobacterium sp. MCBD17_028]PZE77749.1 hypothetical protein DEI82_02780 [Curtobacterium sp. MCBD17_019]PZF62042.1 hypothetical protein DEI92_00495 [Curtobacterium sp. MCBD17_034]PZF63045.1 hypothetical protein DEI81_08880 [Curtobacterium sp. MCBD17_013]PZM34025.1 hypothetical protein DEI90_10205 [Curtobacterium sp. MCBD17_031]
MRGRLIFLTGVGVGYVLGARAGRARYEQIRSATTRVWNSDGVQKQVHTIEDFIADRTPDVADFIGETTKKVVRKAGPKGSGGSSES